MHSNTNKPQSPKPRSRNPRPPRRSRTHPPNSFRSPGRDRFVESKSASSDSPTWRHSSAKVIPPTHHSDKNEIKQSSVPSSLSPVTSSLTTTTTPTPPSTPTTPTPPSSPPPSTPPPITTTITTTTTTPTTTSVPSSPVLSVSSPSVPISITHPSLTTPILDSDSYPECKFEILSKQLLEFSKRNQLTISEYQYRKSIINQIGGFIHHLIQAEVHDFGSFSQGLATKDSDLDLALFLPPSITPPHAISVLHYLSYYLQSLGKIETLFHTRVPILKLSYGNNILCDISLCSPELHLGKAKLMKAYTLLSPYLVPLILFIKYWAKKRCLASANIGMLHTFGWALLVVNFFQRRKPSLLPVIDPTSLTKLEPLWEKKNTETLGQLLVGFFTFHSHFDNWENCFSVRTGGLEKIDNFLSSQKNSVRIEDPLEIEQNIGRNIHYEKLKKIVTECDRAKNLLLEYSAKNQDITLVLATLCQTPTDGPIYYPRIPEKEKRGIMDSPPLPSQPPPPQQQKNSSSPKQHPSHGKSIPIETNIQQQNQQVLEVIKTSHEQQSSPPPQRTSIRNTVVTQTPLDAHHRHQYHHHHHHHHPHPLVVRTHHHERFVPVPHRQSPPTSFLEDDSNSQELIDPETTHGPSLDVGSHKLVEVEIRG